jgi:hypothetical protein
MSSSVFFQIVRFGVPYAAGHYRATGEFVQVFPVKQVFSSKTAWCRAWSIFGDEQVMTYFRRPAVLRR